MQSVTNQIIDGALDLVVEAPPPSTRHDDLALKCAVYARAGVPEDWIIDSARNAAALLSLGIQEYAPRPTERRGIASRVAPGFTLNPAAFLATVRTRLADFDAGASLQGFFRIDSARLQAGGRYWSRYKIAGRDAVLIVGHEVNSMAQDSTNRQERPYRSAILTGAAALALLTGSLISTGALPVGAQEISHTSTPGQCAAPAETLSVADIAEQVNPAVVTITNMQAGGASGMPDGIPGVIPGLPGQDEPSQGSGAAVPVGTGTGFVIDEEGHVVTNAHVVDGAQDLTVAFEDGTETDATVVGSDDLLDIAVIQLDLPSGTKLPGLACFGDSAELRPGDPVVAIGSALGEFTNTVTNGIVNATDRNLDGYGLGKLIQHDAKIWHGNSGGPLLNMKGQVVGVNAAGISSGGMMDTAPADIGFAIDGNEAHEAAESIIEHGTVPRPFLGIQGEALPRGQMVTEVVTGSPAADAGLRPDDIILAVDGEAITRKTSLLDVLLKHNPGDEVTLTIDRGGDEQTIAVTLGERPANAQ
ncbi:MAG: trypsin-like peptidase domain-containing protein [Thermomicrobiales bacterium]|nr:trypsin-like peptidase domain-containing protein [Thermomicrobiales bacterium]